MNKQVFTAICDRLDDQVPALRWIDWDSGQIDIQDQRPAVAFPACLVDINYPQCDNTGRFSQNVVANITLRLVFMPAGNTHHQSPVRDDALQVFDTIEDVHEAMQGWGTTALSSIERTGAQPEKRRDGLKVYRVTYQTTFSENVEPVS